MTFNGECAEKYVGTTYKYHYLCTSCFVMWWSNKFKSDCWICGAYYTNVESMRAIQEMNTTDHTVRTGGRLP